MDRINEQPIILVVEDNLENLNILNTELRKISNSCICLTEGMKALMLIETHHPKIIILDMELRDISGIQVIDYLKRNPATANIPIIAITSQENIYFSNFLKQLGASMCIRKPYNIEELIKVVIQYLN
jgi:two-component system, cell cycle response regulator DivK